jgi:DNA repair exonuclease SbcCD ATPase subunit
MAKYSDVTITCSQCGKSFTFSEDEQEFYKLKGFTQPQRCKPCRSNSRQQSSLTCSHCGNKLGAKDSLTCISCLTAVQLEADLKVKSIQSVLEEANAKLSVLESERSTLSSDTDDKLAATQAENARLLQESNARVAASESEKDQVWELLKQKDQLIAELEWRLQQTIEELEKAHQYRASLEGLEPSLTGLNDKLGFMERNQSNLIKTLMQIADKLDEKHKSPGLLDILKDLVRLDQSRVARE